ncbi:tRNA wybutosine-synthesizing protein 3 [Geosmithia morbida]|uniref:tRNA(Phe) 7-[(3-amino-3-carboxypropyl)-4-demethylwyosine(37)-N(4)]-methyltransferase n=1 Tax=Geosmithia morbida TaxID=1094350 RepID=A0A9P4YZ47_9HYPO|nr:tRNA wybutosine-synthesizing protein 3 [Geosmithia morbida]KAF4124447.1 tRNA wybutosine-synthesizing protein 3 [Geosmithia morbida]
MQGLRTPPAHFSTKKTRILDQLAVPDAEYSDASPKGTVDEGIRHLIDQINQVEGFVTTSSCAGRVSVFVEGQKKTHDDSPEPDGGGERQQVAGVGGKGAGGAWLFVSHDVVGSGDWISALQLEEGGEANVGLAEQRLIHFKFEPMILHVLAASPPHAQLLIRAALQAGFRESGAVNLTAASADDQPTPMVAVRSMGLSFESLIGSQVGPNAEGGRRLLVSKTYLETLMAIANERFAENAKRITRFQDALSSVLTDPPPTKMGADGTAWENAAVRRERKRVEGLQRRAQLQRQKTLDGMSEEEAIDIANALSGL